MIRMSLLAITVALMGCSNAQVYEGMKQHRINQCMEAASNTEYDECVKEADESFNKYKRDREDALVK